MFGDRIYLFGSHDVEGGGRYCAAGNYLAFFAPTDDLSDWRCDGEIFNAKQSPFYRKGGENDLYAPDVVRGNTAQHTSDQTVPASGAQTAGSAAAGRQLPTPGSPAMAQMLKPVYKMLFHREADAVEQLEYPLMGANTVELEDDMLTVRGPVKRIVPGQFDTSPESSFFGHAFYEASSIRKINGLYYSFTPRKTAMSFAMRAATARTGTSYTAARSC